MESEKLGMTAFYRNLAAGLPRAEALRAARLELRARYPDPRHWGGFILQGETGPLPPAPPANLPATAPLAEPPPDGQLVYDVAADYAYPVMAVIGLFFYAAIMVSVAGLAVGEVVRRGSPPDLLLAAAVAVAVAAFGAALFAPRMLPRVWDQRRCKRWAREGAFQTVEGVVSDYRWFAYPTKADKERTGVGVPSFFRMLTAVRFRVGGETFVVEREPDRGGFRLSGMPDVEHHTDVVRPGLRLRIGHRGGRILRVEVLGEGPEDAPAPAEAAAPVAAPTAVEPPSAAEPYPTLRRWLLEFVLFVGVPLFALPVVTLVRWFVARETFGAGATPGKMVGVSFLCAAFPTVLALVLVGKRLGRMFRRAWDRPPDEPRTGVSAAGHPTRVLYDVLDDRAYRRDDAPLLVFAGATAVLASLVVAAVVGVVRAFATDDPPFYSAFLPLFPLFLFTGFAFSTWGAFRNARAWVRDQARCKEWRRTGACTVTEGVATDWRFPARGPAITSLELIATFKVAGVPFVFDRGAPIGGFRLDGVQGVYLDKLEETFPEGAVLRITHRDGRILRIEVLLDPTRPAARPVPAPAPAPARPVDPPPASDDARSPVRRLYLHYALLGAGAACAQAAIRRLTDVRDARVFDGATPADWPLAAALVGCVVLILADRFRDLFRRAAEVRRADPTAVRVGQWALFAAAAGLFVAHLVANGVFAARPYFTSVAYSDEAGAFVATGSDGRARHLDPDTGTRRRTVELEPTRGRVRGGDRVAWAEKDEIRVADAATGETRHTFAVKNGAYALAFSPDGRRLAAACWGHEVRVFDLDPPREALVLKGHPGDVRCLAWSPDGSALASGGRTPKGPKYEAGGDLRVWDARTGAPLAGMPESHKFQVTAVALSPDGRRLASASSGGTVKVWDAGTWRLEADLSDIFDRGGGAGQSVAWSPSGRLAVVSDGGVLLLDPAAGVLVRRIRLRLD